MPITPPTSFPEWVTGGNVSDTISFGSGPVTVNRIQEPSSTQKSNGFLYRVRATYNIFNWLFNLIYQWLVYFDAAISTGGQLKYRKTSSSYMTDGEAVIGVFGSLVTPVTITISDADIALGSTTLTKVITIKAETDQVSVSGNPIEIVGESGQVIDGQSSISIVVDYGSVTLYTDGTNLFTIQ